ncbi:LLM class flavin-dependent oxidoreductase [Citricoccus sp.]|uniref:LLM class flavin-dependent oxidoreductase n=1 Tax=Citricoccus sp. TaxID=1978372 RepID=UPI0026027D98|nr:LLM class flavin-dependent oxidoreductase [Citricoccus sp.]HRO94608.1 LLM class flavin-dependent oxidoreductase [Citricoccus sp.]
MTRSTRFTNNTPPRGGRGILALEVDGDGAHPAAWRVTGRDPAEVLTGPRTVRVVQDAEIAGFHAVTFDDGRLAPTHGPAARLDAVQRAAHAAPATRAIGLVPVVDAVYTEPFHVATQLASLDYVSSGRAGWIVSARGLAKEGSAVGRDALPEAELGGEAADVVAANRRLWDTWEDDAVIRDRCTGRYIDRDKVHYADVQAKRFSVKGPSIIPRPLQGQLPVWAPTQFLDRSGVGDGLRLDAVHGADAVLVSAADPEALLSAATARSAGGLDADTVVAELTVVLDARGQSGAARWAELEAWEAATGGPALFAGTATELTDYLAELFTVAGGVRIHPAVLDVDAAELGHLVLPELRRAGLLAPVGPGRTFRQTLGLARPASRFATA